MIPSFYIPLCYRYTGSLNFSQYPRVPHLSVSHCLECNQTLSKPHFLMQNSIQIFYIHKAFPDQGKWTINYLTECLHNIWIPKISNTIPSSPWTFIEETDKTDGWLHRQTDHHTYMISVICLNPLAVTQYKYSKTKS